MHIIEELVLFLEPQPLQHLKLDAEKAIFFFTAKTLNDMT